MSDNSTGMVHPYKQIKTISNDDKCKIITSFVTSLFSDIETVPNETYTHIKTEELEVVKISKSYSFPELRKLIEYIVPELSFKEVRFIMEKCIREEFGNSYYYDNGISRRKKVLVCYFTDLFDQLYYYDSKKLKKYLVLL